MNDVWSWGLNVDDARLTLEPSSVPQNYLSLLRVGSSERSTVQLVVDVLTCHGHSAKWCDVNMTGLPRSLALTVCCM